MKRPSISKVVRFVAVMTIILQMGMECHSQDLTWQRTNGPYGGRIFAMGCGPNGVLVAASENCGIFRSTDDGETWQQTSLSSETIRSFAVDSQGRIFAGSSWAPSVYVSSDAGVTWSKANAGMANQGIECLTISSRGYVFAGSFYGSLYRSKDAGVSWTRLQMPITGSGVYPVRSVCVDSSGNVYAGIDGKGVYRSSDDGETWRMVGLEGGNAMALISPSSREIVAGMGNTVYRSTDSGATWLQLGNSIQWIKLFGVNTSGDIFAFTDNGLFRCRMGAPDWDMLEVCLNSTRFLSGTITSEGYIFAGSDGDGAARSRDKGATWEETNTGITGVEVATLASTSRGIMMAGTSRGLFVTVDKGSTWSLSRFLPGPVRDLAVISDALIFAATRVGIYRSNDNGVNWSRVYQAPSLRGINSLCADSSNTLYAAISTGQICRSTDLGESWSQVFDTEHYAYALASGRGGIFAGTEYHGIYRSTDRGITWIPANNGIPDGYIERTIFCLEAMRNGDIYAGTPRQLLRSTNGGDFWKAAMDSAIYCWSIIEDGSETIYAGSRRDVYYSSNHGFTWRVCGTGLTGDIVRTLAFDNDGYLYAGMVYGGVFRTVQNVKTELPKTFRLSQNYPNPFNGSTIIEFSLPYTASAVLKVYNVLGQEIETLVSSNLNPGNHGVRWNAGVASGVYFYHLEARPADGGQAEGFVETKKMILLH